MKVVLQSAVLDVIFFCPLFMTLKCLFYYTNKDLLAYEKAVLQQKTQELATEKYSSSLGDKNPSAHRRQTSVAFGELPPKVLNV